MTPAQNKKQINFMHFTTGSQKGYRKSNFFPEGNKNGSKKANIFVKLLRQFPIISEDFRRLLKMCEDCRRFPSRNPTVFPFSSSLTSKLCQKFLFLHSEQILFFSRKTLQTANSILFENIKH